MNDPDLGYAAKSWIAKWPASRASILKGLASDPHPVREAFVAHELDIVRKLHAAKGPFLAGTDTPAGVDVLPAAGLQVSRRAVWQQSVLARDPPHAIRR